MKNIAVPFTGQKIDPSNPTSAGLTLVLLAMGFAALYAAQEGGAFVWSTVSQTTGVGQEGNAPEVL